MRTWFQRLVDKSIAPTDDELAIERKRLLVGAGLFALVPLTAVGSIYIAYGEQVAGWGYWGFAGWLIFILVLFSRRQMSPELAFWTAAYPALIIHLIVILSLGDVLHSGGVVLWGLAYPVATGVVFVPVRRLAPVFVLYGLNVLVTTLVVSHHRPSVPDGVERAILAVNIVTLSLFAVAVVAHFVNQRDAAHAMLREEQGRVRALLLSILPEEIADELTRAPRIIADSFDEVSVLFADVVGFTPLSATMTPAALVELLGDLFARFDDLVERAGLEKIKTIGDCYMVASGIPRPRPDHARALVGLALDMQRVVRTEQFRGRHLELRIGINSGPVVAGVIGRRKFSYDLWGDVVNTASRMESHGVAGAVQLTDATRALVQHEFDCVARGTIDVRGKGPLPVWLVSGPAAA